MTTLSGLRLRFGVLSTKPKHLMRGGISSAALVVLMTAAGAGVAQPPQTGCATSVGAEAERVIGVGACVRSTISDADPKQAEQIPYEDWRMVLAEGQTVRIDLDAVPTPAASVPGPVGSAPEQGLPAAETWDTYLEVRRAGVAEPLAENDDRGDSFNSRIIFNAREAGEYIVRVRPLYSGGGEYDLRIAAAPPPPPILQIAQGSTNLVVPADLMPSESIFGYRTRTLEFDGVAGQRVRLAARTSGPAVLQLSQETSPVASASGDDGSAVLVAILPGTGRYSVEVGVPADAGERAVVIEMQQRAAGPEMTPRRVNIGDDIQGVLGIDSPAYSTTFGATEVLALSEVYALELRANEPVTVTLRADGFDPVLEAGVMSPLGFAAALENDDDGQSLNSRLVIRPTRNGTILLRARALSSGAGPFSLAVRRGEVPLAPVP